MKLGSQVTPWVIALAILLYLIMYRSELHNGVGNAQVPPLRAFFGY